MGQSWLQVKEGAGWGSEGSVAFPQGEREPCGPDTMGASAQPSSGVSADTGSQQGHPAPLSSCAPRAGNGAGLELCRARVTREPGLSTAMGKCFAELAVLRAVLLSLLQADTVHLYRQLVPQHPKGASAGPRTAAWRSGWILESRNHRRV